MTLRVPKILPQVLLGVVARNPTLTEKLLELPEVHVSQGARLTERERTAAVERKGQLLEELGLNLGGWKPHGIHNLGGTSRMSFAIAVLPRGLLSQVLSRRPTRRPERPGSSSRSSPRP